MSQIGINITDCKQTEESFTPIKQLITMTGGEIESIIQNLGTSGMHVYVAPMLRQERKNVEQLGQRIQTMQTALIQIINTYEKSENTNVDNLSAAPGQAQASEGGAYSIDSVLFDDDGSYGGDQGSMDRTYKWNPFKCWELLKNLREYYPNISIFEAFEYFSRLNSVGCGYVALANTLFLEYEGRPQEFERVFGYPMFKDGDLNYDRLILDIYATTDLAGFNDEDDGYPGGTVDASRAEIMQRFLEDKGVSVSTEANAEITPENFQEVVENGGHIVLGYRNGNMYDENGNQYYIDGGHAIVVTGVTEDGRFIVSSWGEKYYINSEDIDSDDSFMVFQYNS